MTTRTAPLSSLLVGRSVLWRIAVVVAGSWLLASTAWAQVPMYPAPTTLQTFGLMVIAALSGRRLTAEIVVAYLAQAAIGLPVLAGGSGGVAHLIGPTGGYLAGFLLAGVAVGWMTEHRRGVVGLLAAFIVGHVIILSAGFAWLSALIGPQAAWTGGVAPFFVGSVIKTIMAIAVVKFSSPLIERAADRP